MKKSLQLLIIATLTFTFAFTAQATSKKVYNGYVVTISNETIHGQIQMLSPTLNEVKVKFIHKNGKKEIFKAKNLKAYSFQVPVYNKATKSRQLQWITYTRKNVERSPLPFGTKEVLLEQLEKGQINLYNHFIETRGGAAPMIHMYQVEKGDEMISVTRKNFKKVMKEMTADYPELAAKVGKRGYGYKHIGKIIAAYNAYNTNDPLFGMN